MIMRNSSPQFKAESLKQSLNEKNFFFFYIFLFCIMESIPARPADAKYDPLVMYLVFSLLIFFFLFFLFVFKGCESDDQNGTEQSQNLSVLGMMSVLKRFDQEK